MPSSNILLFDVNKANMMADEQYNTNTQRLNGVQSGIASSQLQNKTLYQVSLVAYAIAQIMNQNGLDANDTAAVSAFVANLSGTMLQKVVDLATIQEAQAGVVTGKWMSPALVKAAIDTLAAKAQNILSDNTKTAFGLGLTAVPDDILYILREAVIYQNGVLQTILGTKLQFLTLETGTYVGTGTYGQANKNFISFSIKPGLWGVILQKSGSVIYLIPNILRWGTGMSGLNWYFSSQTSPNGDVNISYSGKTVSYYSEIGANQQLNDNGVTYTYFGIGHKE